VRRLLVPSAALLWGLQIAFLSPALALILVTLYDASTAQVGWILTVYNASGFVASLLIPSYADRREDYLLPMLACGVLTLVLALVLAFTTSLAVAVVALVVVGGPAGVGSSMLYAHLRHSGAKPADIVNTRAIVSVAWIAGPPLATLIIGAFGNRAILLAIGAIAVLVIATTVVMIFQRTAIPDHDGPAKAAADDRLALRKRAVVLIVAAFVLLQAANATVTSIMTLFVTETMRIDVIWAGIALRCRRRARGPRPGPDRQAQPPFLQPRADRDWVRRRHRLLHRDGLRHRARHAHRPPTAQRLVFRRDRRRRTDALPTDDSPAGTVYGPLHEYATGRRDRLWTDHRPRLDNCSWKSWHLSRLRPAHGPRARRHRNCGSTAGTARDSRPGSADAEPRLADFRTHRCAASTTADPTPGRLTRTLQASHSSTSSPIATSASVLPASRLCAYGGERSEFVTVDPGARQGQA
jgi:hypothetical protein